VQEKGDNYLELVIYLKFLSEIRLSSFPHNSYKVALHNIIHEAKHCKQGQVWQWMPIIPAPWETDIGRLWFEGNPG
jgi:hypothetical protein